MACFREFSFIDIGVSLVTQFTIQDPIVSMVHAIVQVTLPQIVAVFVLLISRMGCVHFEILSQSLKTVGKR